MPEVVTVYYDYVCPFAWRGAELAEQVGPALGLTFTWRHFSLYQNNYEGADGWQLWNQKLSFGDPGGDKGLLPFLASCAARRQGSEKHACFRLETMRARHRDHRPLNLQTLNEVAERVGLDMTRFESELLNPECRTVLAHEHHFAVSQNIFGTPTFSFEDGHTAYFRLKELPRGPDEAVELFRCYRHLLERYPYVETVKRPRVRGN
jgi:predicted DsbA family dithiol-disulfide isomerase